MAFGDLIIIDPETPLYYKGVYYDNIQRLVEHFGMEARNILKKEYKRGYREALQNHMDLIKATKKGM